MEILFFIVALTSPLLLRDWKHEATFDLTGAQTQVKNWKAGGEDIFSWQGQIKGLSQAPITIADVAMRYDLIYGQSTKDGQGLRKTSDEFHIELEVSCPIDWIANPYISVDARSQMTKRYNYTDTGRWAGTKIKFQSAWRPGYSTISTGMGRKLFGETLTVRTGAALRHTWEGSVRHIETTGIETVIRSKIPLSKYSVFTDEFCAFKGDGDFAIRNEAILRIQVARFITVNISYHIISDRKQSPDPQMRYASSIGIGYTL